MKTILVTGGAGFIGSNLAAELLTRGTHRLVISDHFGSDEKWRNLSHTPVHEIVAPPELPFWLQEYGKDVELIFHIGGISSTTEKDIALILRNNMEASIDLWRWCTENNVRFVYATSSATYGDGSQGFEDSLEPTYLRKLTPLSGYGWSKHMFDSHVAFTIMNKEPAPPQWVGLKIFNTYGPNEYHKESQKSVICQIAQQALHAGSVKLFRSYNPKYPDGGQMRDMIYVKDVVRVMLWMLDNPQVNGLFNLGSGKARTFNDMAQAVFAALGRPSRIHYIDMPEGLVNKYQYFTEANMKRLHDAGYTTPFTSIEDGIKDYVVNYLSKQDPYA